MSDKNFITFRIKYHVEFEEGIYIVLDCQQMKKYPVRMECNQMDKNDIWEVILQFQEDRDIDEEISYYYQVADFHNENFFLYNINWENSSEIMVRKFKREIYLNKSLIIFDSCNQRNLQISSSEDQRMKNKEIRNLAGKLIKINLCIKKKVGGEGRWIYGMPMPDKLVENFTETDFLKAVKLQRIPTQKPNVFYWKKIWVFTVQQYEQLGGSTNFAFFESFYYRRQVSDWIAILPNGKSAPLAQIAKMLEQSDTPYEIQIIDQSNGEVIQSISYKTQDLYKQNFIYQTSDDLDPTSIFQVYLVFENLDLGRYKMTRRASNPKFWQVEVTLCKMDEKPLYYFDVHNVIDFQTNQLNRTNTFSYSYPDPPQNGSNRNLYVNIKGSISQSHSYKPRQFSYNRYYSPPVTPRQQENRRQIKQTHIYSTYPTHTTSKISDTTSYYYNRRPEYIRSKLWNPQRTYSSSSSISTSGISINSNIYSTNQTHTNSSVPYTSSSTPVINQNSYTSINNTTYISNPNTTTYYDYQNYFKETYPTYSTQSTTSNISNISSHSYSSPIITRTDRNIYTVLNNANNYGYNVSRYYNNAKNLFNMTQEQIRYVKVKDFIDPIKLKLIKTSKIQQISDKFQKQTQALIKNYPEISEKFLELKDLRAQLSNNHKLQQQQIKKQKIKKKKLLFMIQLMTISKKWGKSKYSQPCQQELYQILTKYNLIRKQSQETIFWILYYINQQTISKKYNQIACNSSCNKCGKQAQFQQELKKIMKQIQNKLKIKEVSKQTIIKQKLYQNIIDCISSSYVQLNEYALNKQLQLFKNNTEECLMRTLLNYAIIYSIGRRVFSTNLFGDFKDDCGQFVPFCREMNSYISVFKWQDLQKLQEYLQNKNLGQLKQIEQKELSPLEIKLIQTEKQVVKQIQTTANKELIDLINVTIDLDKAKKIMEEKNKNQLEIKCFINLYDDDEEEEGGDGDKEFSPLQKQIEQIDNIQDEKERFVRIRSLKNNRFEKAGFKFN